jgi:mannose-6-phosphate isomerase-like protein (cupin superfamily)
MIRSPRRVEKPWGHEEIWAETATYVGKVLFVRAGHRLSLQHHEVKDETIRIATGTLVLTIDDSQGVLHELTLGPGQAVRIPPGRRHRMRAITDVEILEVSTPELDDVVRHDDDYGRT